MNSELCFVALVLPNPTVKKSSRHFNYTWVGPRSLKQTILLLLFFMSIIIHLYLQQNIINEQDFKKQ